MHLHLILYKQSTTVQQKFSNLDDKINSIQTTARRTSDELNALKKEVETRLRRNYATISYPAVPVIALLQAFLIITIAA